MFIRCSRKTEASEYKYQFSDYFYEKVLQPSYRKMLEVFNKLYNEYEYEKTANR